MNFGYNSAFLNDEFSDDSVSQEEEERKEEVKINLKEDSKTEEISPKGAP